MVAKNIIVKVAFELRSLSVFEKHSKKVKKHHQWSPSSFYGGPPEVRKLPITEFICEILPCVLLQVKFNNLKNTGS